IGLTVEPSADGIAFVFEDGRRLRVASAWTPGQPVWRGELDGRPAAAQVRPILNGFEIAHGGAEVAARVYTQREAEFASLMIERKAADNSRALKCPMPGLVKSVAVTEGQE